MKISTQYSINNFFTIVIAFFLLTISSNKLYAQCVDQSPTGDCDGDLVLNADDFDNDNDGILDVDEGCITPFLPEEFFIPMYHSNIVNAPNKKIFITGEDADPNSAGDITQFTEITPGGTTNAGGNWASYSGTNVKGVGGSDGSNSQFLLLTTTNLYNWGDTDDVIEGGNWTNVLFPFGTTGSDFKDITATASVAVLITNAGELYTRGVINGLSIYGHNGTPRDTNLWYKVQTSTGDLTGVEHIRITPEGAFAITSAGDWYTWGETSFLGDNSNHADRDIATLMTKPAAFSGGVTVQQIAMTSDDGGSKSASYYVLGSDGLIYAMGGNAKGQLGDNSTTERESWVNVEVSGGANLQDVVIISADSYSRYYAGVGAITEVAGQRTIYTWGENNANILTDAAVASQDFAIEASFYNGAGAGSYTDINTPAGVGPEDRNPIRLGMGGHISMYYDSFQEDYGFVGDNINGAFGATASDAGKFSLSGQIAINLLTTCPDTDGDGTPDNLDLDSDNDGCPDALEGGDNILLSAVDSNGALTGMVAANGVPNNVNMTAGQTIGTSTNSSAFDTFGQCLADLSLTKTIDNATPSTGDTIIFTIVLSNSGFISTTGVQVEDILPTGLLYDSGNSTIPAGTTYNNGTGIWDLSAMTINNGDTFTLQIAATVTPACGEITNTAEIISSDILDSDSTTNNGN